MQTGSLAECRRENGIFLHVVPCNDVVILCHDHCKTMYLLILLDIRQLWNDVYLSLIILTIVLLNQIDCIIIFSYCIIFQRFEDFHKIFRFVWIYSIFISIGTFKVYIVKSPERSECLQKTIHLTDARMWIIESYISNLRVHSNRTLCMVEVSRNYCVIELLIFTRL